MRLLIAGLLMILTVASAHAQTGGQQGAINAASQLGRHAGAANANATDEAKVKANDKAYNAALRNLPDKQYDPWHGVR